MSASELFATDERSDFFSKRYVCLAARVLRKTDE